MIIEFKNVSYRYLESKDYAIKDINLEIDKGEFVLITGRSGCGKSTLLKCLNGLIPHSSQGEFKGDVIVDGLNTKEHPIRVLAQKVGLVFQNPDEQIFSTKVINEIAFGCENLCLPKEEILRRVNWALEMVSMKEFMNANTGELSGGQKQRIAIASVLALKPKIIALDEPLSQLDPKGVKEVLDVLKSLNKERYTIVLVEHRIHEVYDVVDRIVVMDKGKIILDDEPERVINNDLLRKLELRLPNMKLKPIKINSSSSREKVIEVRNVFFSYNKNNKYILKNINFDAYRGEIIAIIGNNGSGKTTLLQLIAGILKPSKGDVIVLGKNTKKYNCYKLAGLVGIIFQNPSLMLFCDTVFNEVIFGLKNLKIKEAEKIAKRWLSIMELLEYSAHHPQTLSGGQRLRCAVASVFSMNPEIILLDEPTSGLDFMHIKKLMNVCIDLAKIGKTIIFVTHDLEIALNYSSRIVAMKNGKIVIDCPTRDISLNHLYNVVYN
ncbi:MAG TPA: energy-coupling factor ABC transporter ATP-binding protein [Archaeoglobus profundus]|nr:energy-coupling factor ABC transporter ATP-binding protein [Archaeoglobus profundus]